MRLRLRLRLWARFLCFIFEPRCAARGFCVRKGGCQHPKWDVLFKRSEG
jgi:hypothetical protein